MNLKKLNSLSKDEAKQAFYKCCASTAWAGEMVQSLPFESEAKLFQKADEVWRALGEKDFFEAFSHHPRIGGNINALRDKWAAGEQKGVTGASEQTLQGLSSGNEEYEKKFGFVFLICATGKSADEMLSALQKRLLNTKSKEIENAAAEQAKITAIRLKKLLEEA